MARLQTGGDRLSVMPDANRLDPRLFAADIQGALRSVGQGMGVVNDIYQTRENAAQRPIREALAQLQLQSAQEEASMAPARERALADAELLRGLQIQEAERQGALAEIRPEVVDTLGAFREGGYFEGPTGKTKDEITGVRQLVRNPDGSIVERKLPTGIVSGADIEEKKSALAQRAEVAQEKLAIEREKIKAQQDIAQAKLDAMQAKIEKASAEAEAKGLELVKSIDMETRETVLTSVDKKTGKVVNQVRLAGVYPTGEQGGIEMLAKPKGTSRIPAGNLSFLEAVKQQAEPEGDPVMVSLIGGNGQAAIDVDSILAAADSALMKKEEDKRRSNMAVPSTGLGALFR